VTAPIPEFNLCRIQCLKNGLVGWLSQDEFNEISRSRLNTLEIRVGSNGEIEVTQPAGANQLDELGELDLDLRDLETTINEDFETEPFVSPSVVDGTDGYSVTEFDDRDYIFN
jgi:hypothetical protein